MPISQQETQIPLHLWTVEDYHRMAEVGILSPDQPVELIAGQIIKKMSPQGTPHATVITLTRLFLEDNLRQQVLVRTQLPVTLSDRSEPEPDVAVVMPDVLRYLDHHPHPSEIYLIIEVADRTLNTDCGIKANDYANSEIQEYWVLNLKRRQLHVFREPTPQGYQREIILAENDRISPLQFPNLSIAVTQMLPPR